MTVSIFAKTVPRRKQYHLMHTGTLIDLKNNYSLPSSCHESMQEEQSTL